MKRGLARPSGFYPQTKFLAAISSPTAVMTHISTRCQAINYNLSRMTRPQISTVSKESFEARRSRFSPRPRNCVAKALFDSVQAAPQPLFHLRPELRNGIELKRVGRKIQDLHIPQPRKATYRRMFMRGEVVEDQNIFREQRWQQMTSDEQKKSAGIHRIR